MLIRKVFIYLSVAALLATVLIWVPTHRQFRLDTQQGPLGFPFEVKEETAVNTGFGPMRKICLILDREYYSKDNLDRLFRYYSKKHPHREERLRVEVYTSLENWEGELESRARGEGFILFGGERPFDPQARRVFYDAVFYREGHGDYVRGGDDEWYSYSPDLDKPNEKKVVILKGTLYFRSKTVLETWEASSYGITVRAIAYELKDVDPPGIYYTFESPEEGSDSWRVIMTFRRDEQIPIPRDQVRFVDDKIAYIFMGPMYAVTINGGHTWSVWDAERDFPGGEECCSEAIIQEVSLKPNGEGVMTLRPNMADNTNIINLYTKEYGKHWKIE